MPLVRRECRSTSRSRVKRSAGPVPVVFARNPAQHLCPPGRRPNTNGRVARPYAADDAVENRTRIGIWNAHRMIPHLPDICERLTRAQTQYALNFFFPAPIGTWRRNRRRSGIRGGGNAGRALENGNHELAVEQLIRMINFPLKDARTSYLYYWRRDPLIVTSTFELLEQLNEQDYGRADDGAFRRGTSSRNSPTPTSVGWPIPLYNEKRDIRSIAGRIHVLCELP